MTAPPARLAATAALALLLAAPGLAPVPAAAQPAARPGAPAAATLPVTPPATPAPAGEAAPSEAEAPEGPAAAPAPADLSAGPRPALPMDIAALPLSPDFARLPVGGWRMGGRAGRGEADHAGRLSIETIGRYLAQQSTGRVTILAQAAGPADDASLARRATLARAISVKASLVRGGLAGTRIDIRPMGRLPEAVDAIDILAPPAPPPRPDPAPAPAAAPPPAPAPAAQTRPAPSQPAPAARRGG